MNEIQQLRKFDPELGQARDIFPITKVEAIGAGVSIIYDISAANNNQHYPDLQTALGEGGSNIPQEYRNGGLTVKFIQGIEQSSSNKYVQYRLISNTWSINIIDWITERDIAEEVNDIYFNIPNGGDEHRFL